MKTDIILAGVGGQGILSIAASIGQAALKNKLYVKQAETHGMSQRGGDVVSHLRISDSPIYSDLIPKGKADLIIAVEPMEGLRYINYLSDDGYLVSNTTPFNNITDYPETDQVLEQLKKAPNLIAFNADEIASNLKSKRSSNMVILGASSPFLNGIKYELLEEGIREIFKNKGDDIINVNLKALSEGKKESDKKLNS